MLFFISGAGICRLGLLWSDDSCTSRTSSNALGDTASLAISVVEAILFETLLSVPRKRLC